MRVEVIPQFALGAVTLKRVGDSLNHAMTAPGCERFRFAVAYIRFFCMVTDVRLDTTNPQVLADPPDEEEDLMRQVLASVAHDR